jgi:hypothetical protein
MGIEMNVEAERAAFEAWFAAGRFGGMKESMWAAWEARAAQPADVGATTSPQAAQGMNASELFVELRDAVTECINHERNSKNWSAADYWRDVLAQFDAWRAAPPLSSEPQAEKGEAHESRG